MKKRIQILGSCALMLLTVFTIGCTEEEGLKVNDPAPDFTLTDTYGVKLGLDDYRGEVVILDFTPVFHTLNC